jgi:SAM-dependent methyltransferase
MSDWFEDEAFWEGLFSFLFPAARFAAAESEIDKLVRLVDFQGGKVLDVACGPGRHSVALAKRGYVVTGIDRSKFLLQKARNHAAEAGNKIEWVEEDMRHFVRQDSFDLAISLFTSFGYFAKEEENLLVLQNIFQNLKPGGLFLMDILGKERLARQYQPTLVHEIEDGGLLIERPKIVDDWSGIQNEWILIQGVSVRRFYFHHTVYSGKELKSMLLQAGFSTVKLYGDLDGNEYGVDAPRLVAVARK